MKPTATLACPSCARPVQLPLRITSDPRDTKPGTIAFRVAVDAEFLTVFEQHVLDDPDAHADFFGDSDDTCRPVAGERYFLDQLHDERPSR